MAGILVVDDAQITHHLFENILGKAGYTVCGVAENGREGLEKYRQLDPDLVFCDIMMREMDGLEFLRAVVSEDPDVKVVMCTSQIHIVDEAREAGATDFIAKPIKAVDVLAVTEKLIGKPPGSANVSYKNLMEKRAAAAGLDNKCVLDFFEAFHKVNDFYFDDPRVDRQFLADHLDALTIGTRALISAKMSKRQVDQLMEVFRGLVVE